MPSSLPIYSIAKEINIESNRIIIACKKLGIEAKGSTKRLNNEEIKKIKSYFESGKNVAEEIVDLKKTKLKTKGKLKSKIEKTKIKYFGNRLMGKH